jgi:MYXO-CTERM domain-containing protein
MWHGSEKCTTMALSATRRRTAVKALTLLAVLLLLPAVPTASAQEAAPTEIATDPPGDSTLAVQDAPVPTAGRWAAADLQSLRVLETEENLVFQLQVDGLDVSPEAPLAESTFYTIDFLQRDRMYRVALSRFITTEPEYFAFAQGYDAARESWFTITFSDAVTVDPTAGTMTVPFSRSLFLDGQGNAPNPETPLVGWRVQANSNFNTDDCSISIGPGGGAPCPSVVVQDSMPDQGNATTALTLRFGITQTGLARLQSSSPVRASNGEATTFVFEVRARNYGAKEDTFHLMTSGLPAGWQVQLPTEHLRIKGNGSVLFPVLVTTPFTHEHGVLARFLLEMHSLGDPGSVGRIQLGVRYMQPPQPTGHHNRLTFHSEAPPDDPFSTAFGLAFRGAPFSGLYMNAAEKDPNDAEIEVRGDTCGFNVNPAPVQTYCWFIPLSPALEMGLDFDLGATGKVSVPVKTLLPMPGTVLDGYVAHLSGRTRTGPGPSRVVETIVADILPAPAVDLSANTGGNVLTAVVQPRAAGDYLPYQRGASMYLVLNLTFTRVDPFFGPGDGPAIQPGGYVELPLSEYHDKVDTLFSTNATVGLSVLSEQDRRVNPGESVGFELLLENRGKDEAEYELKLTGTNAEWASIRAPGTTLVTLEPGAKANVTVAVVVPPGIGPPATADLVLSATRTDDLNVRSLARIVARVDDSADLPDEGFAATVEGGDKGTPAPGVALLGLALLGLALALRRRGPA